MNKITIQLRPYDALAILSFMREFINDTNRHIPELAAIHETVDAYEVEIYKNTSIHHVDDAILESTVNHITGRQPEKEN